MMKGTMGYFLFAAPASGPAVRLHFKQPGGSSFAPHSVRK